MPATEILVAVLSGLLSMAAGGLAATPLFEKILRKAFKRDTAAIPYSERLSGLINSLRTASMEVDAVLQELAQVAQNREAAVGQLEQQLKDLETKEQTLQQRIQHLQAVPLPVAEYFATLTKSGERRSARRDYALFGAGVLVSTVLSVLFFVLGG